MGTEEKTGWPHSWSGLFGKLKYLSPLSVIEPRSLGRLACSVVPVLTHNKFNSTRPNLKEFTNLGPTCGDLMKRKLKALTERCTLYVCIS